MSETRHTLAVPSITLPEHGILVYESRHGAGFRLAEHDHGFHELLIFIDGQGDAILSGSPYPVEAGAIALVGAGVPHRLEDAPDAPLHVLVVAFRPEAIQYHPEFSLLLRPLEGPGTVLGNNVALTGVQDTLRRILYEQDRQQAGWTLAVRTALSDLLLQVYRVWAEQEGSRSASSADFADTRMEELRRYVDEHYYTKLSVESLARRVHLSSRQVSHLFKRRFGLTLRDYLTKVRVERAKTLLATTTKEIVAICFEVGYEDLSHFYRVFKQATGMAPKRFREQALP